ncbi:MAG: biopolymer transporter ExbD [Flavisolibacter sp.]|jgi:biopolymer transport protein ExbD|nr:biopolymer transporter ExbD [Flavisolibacter sp.]
MPSVKIKKKSTWTDMTPFVDVAFLILAFFIMATKFKPPELVEITTPKSVSSDKLEQKDALRIDFDKDGRVFLTVQAQKTEDNVLKKTLIENINTSRNLGLTEAEMNAYVSNTMVGVPFNKLKGYLQLKDDQRKDVLEGIPVTDSADNQLATWVAAAANAFSGKPLQFMIKGDNNAKFPSFKGVIDAMRRNEVFKYQLITDPEGVPPGSELYKLNLKQQRAGS